MKAWPNKEWGWNVGQKRRGLIKSLHWKMIGQWPPITLLLPATSPYPAYKAFCWGLGAGCLFCPDASHVYLSGHINIVMELLIIVWWIFFSFIFFPVLFIFFIVLVLPYIDMNLPWVYMCSLSWIPYPRPSPSHPSGSSRCTSPEHPISFIEPGLAICFTYHNLHVSILKSFLYLYVLDVSLIYSI